MPTAFVQPTRAFLAIIAALAMLAVVGCSVSTETSEAATSGTRGDAATQADQGAAAEGEGETADPAAAQAVSPGDDDRFVVGAVMPTGRDDRGFSQSLVDSLNVLADDGVIDELLIADHTFLDEEAVEVFREYAAGGADLIFGHGPQYGGVIAEVAGEFPNTAFAWGDADETFGRDNISAYTAAAGEGGYVLGTMAARVIGEGSIALIGPSAVGDDKAYLDGFFVGVAASGADTDVVLQYIESYVDVDVADERARASVENEADVLAASSSISPGVARVAEELALPYFGNQVDNSDLAAMNSVASQIYRWEVVVAEMIAGIEAGNLGGESYEITLGNGGLVIEYNSEFELSDEILAEAAELTDLVIAGGVDVTFGP